MINITHPYDLWIIVQIWLILKFEDLFRDIQVWIYIFLRIYFLIPFNRFCIYEAENLWPNKICIHANRSTVSIKWKDDMHVWLAVSLFWTLKCQKGSCWKPKHNFMQVMQGTTMW